MVTMNNSIGIYVHVPFCVQKCKYCDFCSFDKSTQDVRADYVSALCSELEREAACVRERTVDTVFFGGGTPSLLSICELDKMLSVLHKNYNVQKNAEITLEMNPATANKEKMKSMHQMGINRVSIGMQSSDDKELELLGRIHTYSDFLRTFDDARAAGFDSINADVMYGIPSQTLSSLEKTLSSLTSLSLDHVSAYSLKIEEGTPFYSMRSELSLPCEDEEYGMYLLCTQMLSDAGYSHYEISNYAKKGKQSRHNLKYWRAEEYLGFGVSAYSYLDSKRYGNSRDISDYIKNGGRCTHTDVDELDTNDKMSEYIMLAFRLREGVSEAEFYSRFGVSFSEKYESQLNKFLNSEYMKHEDGRYFLTDKGMYVSNSILVEFI